MKDDAYVNLHVRVTKDQRDRLNDYIPWGLRDKMFRALVDDIIDICRQGNGPDFVSLLITRHVKLDSKGFAVDGQLSNNKQEHNGDE